MSSPAALHELSLEVMRALYDFVHAPGLEADPARLRGLLDDGAADTEAAFTQSVIRERLGLGDAEAFDPADSAHRIALLPRDGLAFVAWRLGLACGASRFRRLIRRHDLADLGDALSDQDWHFISNRMPGEDAASHHFAEVGAADLPRVCHQAGWCLLDRLCDTLPADIGKRLRLKLPPDAGAPAHGSLDLAPDRFMQICALAAAQWDCDWDAAWAHPAASA